MYVLFIYFAEILPPQITSYTPCSCIHLYLAGCNLTSRAKIPLQWRVCTLRQCLGGHGDCVVSDGVGVWRTRRDVWHHDAENIDQKMMQGADV
jgi:hypothetical protein